MNTFRISFLAIVALFFVGCASEPKPPSEPLIERNEEVREYFVVVGELVDEYCDLVEDMMDKAERMEEKEANGEEVTVLDGLDMLSGFASSGLKIKRLTDEIEEMEERQEEFEKNLSTADYEEFLELYAERLARFYQLAKKAEELDD